MILLNFKTYPQSTGENAVFLAEYLEEVRLLYRIDIAAVPQMIDFRNVQIVLPQNTWVQHIDSLERGRATGWQLADVAKEAGAVGVTLNHSEHKLPFDTLTKTIIRCKDVGLKTLIFADSVDECKHVAELLPDYIGYEPPELIASKDTSVARAKPEIIQQVVQAVPQIPILVGAGVKDQNDVRVSLQLGAKGVALASAAILVKDQKAVLEDLAKGFK